MRPRIGQLLLDFDGVLARYRRQRRVAHLAAHAGVDAARVQAVLYDSGLERCYDAGAIDTPAYLQALGEGIGAPVGVEEWQAARLAATEADAGALERLLALPGELPMAILTNNGVLMAQVIPAIVPALLPRLQGRVLCSGQLGGRKPDPAVFAAALARLDWPAASTLFIDDLFVNVQGARRAGMQAESVRDARALGRVLKRFLPA